MTLIKLGKASSVVEKESFFHTSQHENFESCKYLSLVVLNDISSAHNRISFDFRLSKIIRAQIRFIYEKIVKCHFELLASYGKNKGRILWKQSNRRQQLLRRKNLLRCLCSLYYSPVTSLDKK